MKIIKVINNNVVDALDKDAPRKSSSWEKVSVSMQSRDRLWMRSRLRRRSDWRIRSQPGSSPGWWRGFRWNILQIIRPDYHLCQEQYRTEVTPEYLSDSDRSYQFSQLNGIRKGMQFDNPLKVEVKTFIRSSLALEKYDNPRKVREKLDVELNEDEAASVALHIVNAEYDTGVRNTMNITCPYSRRGQYRPWISEYWTVRKKAFITYRFITHLKFLDSAIFTGADARGWW